MVGLEQGKVRLEPYSDKWPRLFAREEKALRRKLRPLVEDIQHIGSTAIPGMPAKPIIDVAVRIPNLANLDQVVRAMAEAGYVYKGEYGLAGRHFFTKGNPVTHHAHVVERGSQHWSRWIMFRDHLRKNTAARDAYRNFKDQLARKYATDRDEYTSRKNPFIEKILEELKAS